MGVPFLFGFVSFVGRHLAFGVSVALSLEAEGLFLLFRGCFSVVTFTRSFFCAFRRYLRTCMIWRLMLCPCTLFVRLFGGPCVLFAFRSGSGSGLLFQLVVLRRLLVVLGQLLVVLSFFFSFRGRWCCRLPFSFYNSFILCFLFSWLWFLSYYNFVKTVKYLSRPVLPFERVVLVSLCDSGAGGVPDAR